MLRSRPPVAPPLVRLALAPLPLAPLQPLLALCLNAIVGRHPNLFDRLGAHAGKRIGLNPTDLPFSFVLVPRRARPAIRAVRRLPPDLDANISGPFAGLIGLIDGAYDGDALVFSRDLLVEGDMEAVLALRNAIDNAEIDFVGEAAASLGVLAGPAQVIVRALRRAHRSAPSSQRTTRRAWS
ncbi:MAG: hypothetical protein FD124_1114 [Alphaproteobacteria bacterium]|nr:MAG: hypothetical protein FD160_1175 [Caulobacteraceae bacterium]TPW07487.1 MAG: hypothetical protein FD124_1114 [Alphaproteobacteria bacterium]